MLLNSMRILVIGNLLPGTGETLRHLTVAGWGSRVASSLQEARDLFDMCDFRIVLASEVLPDGRGYDFADPVLRRAGTLIVGVALSESCLWLPVIYRGVSVLGRRALAQEMLEQELKDLLGTKPPDPPRDNARDVFRRSPFVPAPVPQRTGLMRRKYRDRDKMHLPVA